MLARVGELDRTKVPAHTLGHLHVAGPPCVAFASLGRRAGGAGPSVAVFAVWSELVRRFRPRVVLVQSVRAFAPYLFEATLSDLYHIQTWTPHSWARRAGDAGTGSCC